jgi:hypothetical protein
MSAHYFLSAPPLELVGILLSLRIDHLLAYFEKKNRTGAEAMKLKQFDPARSSGALESSSF